MNLNNGIFIRLLNAVEKGIPAVLYTLIEIGDYPGLAEGSRILIIMGEGRYGSLGLPELDEQAMSSASDIINQAAPHTKIIEISLPKQTGDNYIKVLEDSFFPQKKLLVFGAGHVAQPLVEMASILGFKTIVVDDRPEFVNPKRFPNASGLICVDYQEKLPLDEIDSTTCIVIITRGHKYDQSCLSAVLDSSACYIGMIGSSSKVRLTFQQLLNQGIEKKKLEKVSAPIGLDLGGQKPAEIALSIMAEIVAKVNSGSCRPLKEIKAGTLV